jgi:hypothetical protein
MAESIAPTSELSSRDYLTQPHVQSDLPKDIHILRTFKLSESLSKHFAFWPPNKRKSDSPIWLHGYPLSKRGSGVKYWLCGICYNQVKPVEFFKPAAATNRPQDHLKEKHYIDKHGRSIPKKQKCVKRAREGETIIDKMARIEEHRELSFDDTAFKAAYLEWVVGDQISLRKSTSSRFHKLLDTISPDAGFAFRTSHNTPRDWIVTAYEDSKSTVREELAQAKSDINLSLDLWTSDNGLPMLGIVAHFINKDYAFKATLLALPKVLGSHSGENMATFLLPVIKEFAIKDKLGYFVMDNASNNDTLMWHLRDCKDGIPSRL